MSEFTVYPAIDLRRGQVVRLLQGDPGRQTTYGADPAGAARAWLAAGARWLHVVNLDSAFGEQDQANQTALAAILAVAAAAEPPAKVQLGGGLRSLEALGRAFALGLNRAILGTAAVQQPDIVAAALDLYGPDALALALDARERDLQVHGWAEGAGVDPVGLGKRYYDLGLRTAVYTDVGRDGAGTGVDIKGAQTIAAQTGLDVIAAGGVASLDDVRRARAAGLSGLIIGRALYEGAIDLKEALAC